MIYYNGFKVKQVSTSGGGKGILSGGKGGAKEVEYFATIILAIGEGVISEIKVIYQDQGVYTQADYPTPNFAFFAGGSAQPPYDYVALTWPSDARGYNDTAYIAVANAELDSSATVPQINLVVSGIFAATCPLNYSTIVITSGQYNSNGDPISYLGPITLGFADADPASVIYDFLTNVTYGAGFPAALIDTGGGAPGVVAGTLNTLFSTTNAANPALGDYALQTYAQAIGIGWSVALNNVESANSILDRWTKNMTVAPIWTGELLKFIPYLGSPVSSNQGYYDISLIPWKYYVPLVTPIVTLTIDHLLQETGTEDDPITFSRVDPMQVYNVVRMDYRDRTNFFNDNVVEAKDEANVELYGPRIDNIGLAQEYTLAYYANVAAQVQLHRNITVRRNFTFRLGPLWAFLDPMDIIQIPDPTNWGQYIDVRIVSCEDDEEEITTYVAEEFVGGNTPTFLPVSPTLPPNHGPTNNPANPVFAPVIFEPTTAMLTATGFATPQIIVGASGGLANILDSNWGGCVVWVSLDDVNYERVGSITGPSAIGTLTEPLFAYGGAPLDVTNTLTVSMSESDVALPTYGDMAASLGRSLCVVKDLNTFELLSYGNAVLVDVNTYALTDLYRGLYGTASASFFPGSQFLFMGFPTFFETPLQSQFVGHTLWVKLQSFNPFGGTFQDLNNCVPYQYLPTGPTPVGPKLPTLSLLPRRRFAAQDETSRRRSHPPTYSLGESDAV